MVAHQEGWTEERVARLRELWASGLSGGECAALLGGGLTRNGVISKIHRIGAAERNVGPVRPTKIEKPKAEKTTDVVIGLPFAKPASVQRPKIEPIECTPVRLMDLTYMCCRWPVNEPEDGEEYLFCGNTRESIAWNKPYCAGHSRIAFVPSRPRKIKSGMWR